MENHAKRPEIVEALQGKIGFHSRLSTTIGIETMYVAVPVLINGDVKAVARIALPLKEIKSIFLKLRGILFFGILVATLIGFFLSVKLAKGLTEPIETISEGARKIASGDWGTRVYSGSKDEIGDLGRTINFMTRTLKEHIDEVSQEKSRLENILNTMVSGVVVLDHYGLVRIINPAAEEMFGISSATGVGKHNLEVIRNYGLNEQIEKCLVKEGVIEYEFTIRYPEEKVLQCYIAPVYRDQVLAGLTMVFHDITKLRKLEKIRSDFVANASHELRTPLTVISGYVETLLSGALDDRETSEKFVSIIDKETERLQRLVEELLTLSQVESQQEMQIQDVDLMDLINSVLDEMRQRYLEKNISLDLQAEEDLPLVKTNGDRIKQVLVNLLDNAFKYTPSYGQVTVIVQNQAECVKVSIKDTGIGIPAKDLARIFERFYRVDRARSRQLGGFGLGLSIVKHIVEIYGGKIGVNSIPEKGSTFWFTLPK